MAATNESSGGGGTAGTGLTLNGSALDNDLVTGKAGGQTVTGGTALGENLTLRSTSNATLGRILFDSTTGLNWDGTNKRLGLGKSPADILDITGTTGGVVVTGTTATGSTYVQVVGAAGGQSGIMQVFGGSAVGNLFGIAKASNVYITSAPFSAMVVGTSAAVDLVFGTNGTERIRIEDSTALLKTGSAMTVANGTVATTMTSLGPTGSHTTIQEWLTFKNSAGTQRWVPCY